MSYTKSFRAIGLGLILTSLVYCSNDKKDTNPNAGDSSQVVSSESSEEAKNKSSRSLTDTVQEQPKTDLDIPQLDPNIELLREFNQKLQSVRYPDGNTIEGFEYKKWEIPNRQDFVKWIKASGNIIKEALDKLPETIDLEIVGHADTSGPEEKTGNKLGNLFYSKKRAESVKNSLVKLGFPESRMNTSGLGASEPIPGIEGTSAKNRRVTFKLVEKTAKEPKE